MFGSIVVGAFCSCIPDGDEDDADDHGEWMFYGVEAACAVGHGFTGEVFDSERGQKIEDKTDDELEVDGDHGGEAGDFVFLCKVG